MKKLGLRLRDLIFGFGGAAILYHEVVLVSTAEPILVFTAFFLLGLIPASRADAGAGMGVKEMLKQWLSDDNEDDKKHNNDNKDTNVNDE